MKLDDSEKIKCLLAAERKGLFKNFGNRRK